MGSKHIHTKYSKFINKQIISDDDKISLQLIKFKERKDFIDKKFTLIGKGSGRLVYDINNEYVIKLAKNKKGIAQNKIEIQISNSGKYDSVIAKVLEFDSKGYYLIQQQAESITDFRFEEITGLQFDGFLYYLRHNKEWDGGNKTFYDTINSLVDKFDLDRYDISDKSAWGEINGRVVIVDYGLDSEIARKLYGVKY